MKNNRLGKNIAIVVASVLAVASLALTGCSNIVIDGRNGISVDGVYNVSYDEGKYTIGDTEYTGDVTGVNIDWIDGQVDITYHDEDTIVISETYEVKSDESSKMRTRFEDGILDIRYCSRSCMIHSMKKNLSVVLPKGITLETFAYSATSAQLVFDEITAKEFKFDSTSGTLDCDMIKATDEVSMNVTSGNVTVAKAVTANSFSFDSTSGTLKINGAEIVDGISVDSTSGNCIIEFAKMCNISHSATSGNLKLTVPSDAEFVVRHDATSGKTNVNVPMIISDDKYVVGAGTYSVESDTTSGDVDIDSM